MDRSADWLKQANRDLQAAEVSAGSGHHEWAAFQAQQCGEKAVKALVQALHGSVRGHAITEILRLLPASLAIPQNVIEAANELDRVYFTSRYPNGFPAGSPSDYFSEASSQRFIGYAKTVLEFCRSQIH
jgi:HEPN domain-containing protein